MTLALTITNVEKLDNGVPTRLTLDRHGALIGRSPQADWSLPDPQLGISSSHCDIDYRDSLYVLTDHSTNGTYVNGRPDRLAAPYPIVDGDEILIGPYRILARLDEVAAAKAAPPPPPESQWKGWESHGGQALPTSPAEADSWGAPPPQAAISGGGAMSANWAAPSAQTPPTDSSVWATPEPAAAPPSAWSSPVTPPPADPSASDVWGKLADGNQVDWARGGFGAEPPALAPAPAHDPFGLAPPTGAPAATPAKDPFGLSAPAGAQAETWGAPAPAAPTPPAHTQAPPARTQAPPPAPRPAPSPAQGGEWVAFLSGAGLGPADVRAPANEAMAAAGDLLRRLIAGMVVMLEARARAKAQLGAQGTALSFEGNNPLKFARAPDKALAQLLSPAERGFMPADRAVEDAFRDLQAHQMATLGAMQGALAATLARFSPQAIRERAESRGLLAKIIPAAREAELWKAYEREFEGVARGSDEAFMDVFAREFRQAYEKAAAEMKR